MVRTVCLSVCVQGAWRYLLFVLINSRFRTFFMHRCGAGFGFLKTKTMRTFTAWLAANFEIFAIILSVVVVGTMILATPGYDLQMKLGLFMVMFFAMMLTTSISTRNLVGSAVLCLLFVILHVMAVRMISETDVFPHVRTGILILLSAGVVSVVAAFVTGIFTARNMGEVVSRRLLYHSSNVELFSLTLFYSLNRAFAVFAYLNWMILWPVLYVLLVGYSDELSLFLEQI